MKKILIILFSLILHFSCFAQSFPRSNAIWNIKIEEASFEKISLPPPMPYNENVLYCMEGDTIINDTLYRRLYNLNYAENHDTVFIAEQISKYNFLGGIREENQKVWFRMHNQEYLLYDFGASAGDTVWHNLTTSNHGVWYVPSDEPSFSIIQNTSTIANVKYLYTYTNLGNTSVWIEGMGSDNGLFGHLPMNRCLCYEWFEYSLGCFKHNDTIKYISCECGNCFYCPFTYPLRFAIGYNDHSSYFPMHDTVYFSYQAEPIFVNLRACTPPIGAPVYVGVPPFTYFWTTNSETYIIEDNMISNPTLSFQGEVDVYLKVRDACGGSTYDTLTLSMNSSSEISSNDISNNFSIFPNPTRGIFNVKMAENIELKSINIHTIDGKLIMGNRYSFRNNQINLSELEAGSYIITIETNKGYLNKLIIKN